MSIAITPRLGRLRVRDHCSFFWADYRDLRVVQVCDEHCQDCLEELKRDAERNHAVLQLVRTDAATTAVLGRIAQSPVEPKES